MQQFFALKLEQLFAFGTVKMIVLRIAVIVFVNTSAIEGKLPKQSSVNKLTQRSVNGRSADVSRFAFQWQPIHQLISIKVIVLLKHTFQN